MLKPAYTKQFVKDIKRMFKRGKSQEKIKTVISKLVEPHGQARGTT